MNSVNLIGRLVADAEKFGEDGKNYKVAKFTLAINNGEKAIFIKVNIFSKSKKLVDEYLKKGKMVGITGILDINEFKTKKGDSVTQYVVIGDKVMLC